jgi:hypothetical protein
MQPDMPEVPLSKAKDETRAEHRRQGLGKGVHGKYFDLVSKGAKLVLLNDKVAKVFPNAEAVNEAGADRANSAADQPRKASAPQARCRLASCGQ